MAEYCTIFGHNVDYAGVLGRIRERTAIPVDVVGDERRWKSLVLKGREATLTLNSMEREKPGDDFSRLVLSTHNFLRKSRSTSASKDAVLRAVSTCSIAVGVVAEPGLNESEGHMECVLEVARILRGVIFNGSAMLDSDGALLFDASLEGA